MDLIFQIFTAAAADERKNVVILAFETMEKIVREYFSYITETEILTFTDCVKCLLAFTTSKFNSDVSLNAIAFLRYCAVKLAEGGLVSNEKSTGDDSAPEVKQEDSDADTFSDKEGTMSFWVPLLIGNLIFPNLYSSFQSIIQTDILNSHNIVNAISGLSKLTSDPRSAIRKSSLEVLFNILKDHGHLFSSQFWVGVFSSVIFPIFESETDKRENAEDNQYSASPKTSHAEGSMWDSETTSVAAECLIDLFFNFFDIVRSQLPGVVSILTGFISSPVQGPSGTGYAALVRLSDDLGSRFSEEEWRQIFLSLKEASTSAMPGLNKVLRNMDSIAVPGVSQLYVDMDMSDNELENVEDDNLQTAAYVVSRLKSHISTQLLVIQVLFLEYHLIGILFLLRR